MTLSRLLIKHRLNNRFLRAHGTRLKSTVPLPPPPTKYPFDITIGSTTTRILHPPSNPNLVPKLGRYGKGQVLTRTDLTHLEWMLKKEMMGQDMFLIGGPGPYKRRLVNLYAYLIGREIEVVQVTRDLTEADLKQIREIKGRSVLYMDQPSVRTALNGHILVLDGIEKAERNVLPVINNLLENREMHLEDGRHLIPSQRYDKLIQECGESSVTNWGLLRVHPDFRVIALGLPVPNFKGNPLDPPLRSRFQCRNVGGGFGRAEVLEMLEEESSKSQGDSIRKMVDLAFGVNFMNSREFKERLAGGTKAGDGVDKRVGEGVPWFVTDSLFDGVRVFKSIAESQPLSLFKLSSTQQQELLPEIFKLMYPFNTPKINSLIADQFGPEPTRTSLPKPLTKAIETLSTKPLQSQLRALSLLHSFLSSSEDIRRGALICGPQGCGKSTIANMVGELLLLNKSDDSNRKLTVIQGYKDMSVRELFQIRSTDKTTGDTVWRESAFVEAAENGHVCVVDGVERFHESVFGVFSAVLNDGVLLPDGVTVLKKRGPDDDNNPNVRFIHPDFRLIGIADNSSTTDFKLTPEVLGSFLVFNVDFAQGDEELICGGTENATKILDIVRELRKKGASDKGFASLARSLSVSQIKRICKRMERRSNNDDLFYHLSNAVCGQFLPGLEREGFESVLKDYGVVRESRDGDVAPVVTVGNGNEFRIGSVSGVIDKKQEAGKIPRGGVFYDIDMHLRVMESMADDFVNGLDHLLVVGNQGVGKNKIVDRMLEVMGRGREYVQLHRDTTIQSLTTNQRIEGGQIITEDSPLVNAIRKGLVLVVDEADKAPAHVTAVLKTLAERGEMILSDGRRITRQQSPRDKDADDSQKVIKMHPEFRMIVLANRPGYPFLGNQFFGNLSHLFSVMPIDNPELNSEVQLLSGYGGGVVDSKVISDVAKVFRELRRLSEEENVLSYPYSTREAVHVVKHLKAFPGDLRGAFANVFDFDVWGEGDEFGHVRRVVEGVFPGVMSYVGEGGDGNPVVIKIVEGVVDDEFKKRGGGGEGGATPRKDFSKFGDPKVGKIDATGAPHVGGNTWAGGTGGSGTAGLGGVGGPYRLSDGNPVFQVSSQTKDSVPPEVLQKARELNRKLYEEKLNELRMSRHDSSVYNDFLNPIIGQVHSLKSILDSLQAQAEERKWVRHQTTGDLDESKLIEGLIGDSNVYRGRMERKPEPGEPLLKPKLMRLLVDLSGSMYRFNGYDRRLDNAVSSVLMVMEAFGGVSQQDRIKYEIYGHSGDEFDYEIVSVDNKQVRDSEKERFLVLKEMYLHSQFCSSGDNTLEATATSIDQLGKVKEEYDEIFVVVLSDANFERYGISAKEFGRVMGRDDGVKCFGVFIGSLGDQAERLKAEVGERAFVCLDVGELPNVLRRILSHSVLR